MSVFIPIAQALNDSRCRYVVVGGLAAVLHGHARLTADVDVILDFEPTAMRGALETLSAIGFQPRLPVNILDFADPRTRETWIAEKNMLVFSLWDPKSPLREVDLFVQHPIDFEELYARSQIMDLGATSVRVASLRDLIALKRLAGRPKDLQDIKVLEQINDEREKPHE